MRELSSKHLLVICAVMGFTGVRPEDPDPNASPALQQTVEYYVQHPDLFKEFAGNPDNWRNKKAMVFPTALIHGDGCTLDKDVIITPAKQDRHLIHKRDHHPAENSDLDDWSKGYLVGRIDNPNGCAVLPMHAGQGVTYWIVRANPNGHDYQSLLVSGEIPEMPAKPQHFGKCDVDPHDQKEDIAAGYTTEEECHHTFMARLVKDKAFRNARFAELEQRQKGTLKIRHANQLKPLTDADFALWFSCYQGCCYADGFTE
ncbi:MAG TPA: hypothetical protein VN706_10355 [Gemmatimonadaceae bacterium]|nr:hypothetical protein [Gemmatimonadaceae bacterium]